MLIILSLALGGILVPLNARIEQSREIATKQILNEVNDGLLGFAIRNGRLPCPASATSNGNENPQGGVCNNSYNGYVPAVSLGLGHLDAQGYILDAWGNRLRYAVAKASSSAFTTTDGMKNAGLGVLQSELLICASAIGTTASSCGAATSLTSISNNAPPVIIFSVGKNGATGGTSTDEKANLDGNAVFISHPPTPVEATTGEFDDMVIWLSPNILYGQMVNAGQLP